MKSYLAPQGLSILQTALSTLPDPPNVIFSGAQIATDFGFVPTPVMSSARGVMLIDRSGDPSSVKITPINANEMIVTVFLDRDSFEFPAIGNVLFFVNDKPLLWLVADQPIVKRSIDNVAHFAGDKVYLPIVFRFPFINKLIAYDDSKNRLSARFPVSDTIRALNIPEHTPADQVAVEKNTLFYGRDRPFFAVKSFDSWWSIPLMNKVDENLYQLDGG